MAIEDRQNTKTDLPVTTPAKPPNLKVLWEETMVEMKKTTWPTWPEARRLTLIVIGVVVTLSIYMGLLDTVLSYIDKALKLT